MDLKRFKDGLIETLLDNNYLTLDVESEDDTSVTLVGSRNVGEIDNVCGVLINFMIDEENEDMCCINFIYQFDEVDVTMEYMHKINEFNTNVPFYKAYLMCFDESEATLTFQLSTMLFGDADTVVEMIAELDEQFDSENALPYLQSLFE